MSRDRVDPTVPAQSVTPAITPPHARAEADAPRAMDSLRRLVHALHVATRGSERSVGLSTAQLFVLRQIALAPGQSMSEIGVRTRTTQSSVSEVVGRLVQRGLVTRRPAAADRRRAELRITPQGEAILARAPETIQERLVAGLGRLGASERRALAATLEAWIAASGLEEVQPVFFFEDEG
jgi:DNA-binding MarR family transcriptional regulator